MRVILLNPIFVIPAGAVFYPVLVVEIPLDGFADACLEAFRRFPTEFVVNFRDIDGVAAVVLGSVPHFVIFCSSKVGQSFFEKLTMATYPFKEQS